MIYARKGNHRCHVCLINVDGKVQERSKRASLCIRGLTVKKAYDRVPREELWYCMRKLGMAEKVCALVQYEKSKTVLRWAIGTTESFKVKFDCTRDQR